MRIELVQPGAGLGPDPGEELVDRLGTWSIRILYLTLLVSSASRMFKIPVLIQHRRTFGLWAFTYVVLHLAAYFSALAGFDFNAVLSDFYEASLHNCRSFRAVFIDSACNHFYTRLAKETWNKLATITSNCLHCCSACTNSPMDAREGFVL